MIQTVTIIGSGNVGFHLGNELFANDIFVMQVFSRQWKKAERLAERVYAIAVDDLADITPNDDLYIIAVKDDAIAEVAQQLQAAGITDELVVHTSGGTPSTILAEYFPRYGSFYPLQTFSIDKEVDFTNLPICVDAKHSSDKELLENLATLLSSNVHRITDQQRSALHVAAVFVNNFTNYLNQVGEKILSEENISLDLLRPLILETAQKVQNHSPADMQTGPAVRNDQATIKRHLEYLQQHPEHAALYQLMTDKIIALDSQLTTGSPSSDSEQRLQNV